MKNGISTDLSEHNIRKIVVGTDLGYSISVGQQFAGGKIEITNIEFNGEYMYKNGIQRFDVYAMVNGSISLWKSITNNNVLVENDCSV